MNEDNGSGLPSQNNDDQPSTSLNQKTALWLPAWHELDQTLVIGLLHRYYFFDQPPAHYSSKLTGPSNVDFIFFNGVDESENSQIRMAKVVRMQHALLGELLRIDTLGLDYIIYPMDGEEVVIDAEESPGFVRSGTGKVEDWTIQVTLEEVSEPIELDVC